MIRNTFNYIPPNLGPKDPKRHTQGDIDELAKLALARSLQPIEGAFVQLEVEGACRPPLTITSISGQSHDFPANTTYDQLIQELAKTLNANPSMINLYLPENMSERLEPKRFNQLVQEGKTEFSVLLLYASLRQIAATRIEIGPRRHIRDEKDIDELANAAIQNIEIQRHIQRHIDDKTKCVFTDENITKHTKEFVLIHPKEGQGGNTYVCQSQPFLEWLNTHMTFPRTFLKFLSIKKLIEGEMTVHRIEASQGKGFQHSEEIHITKQQYSCVKIDPRIQKHIDNRSKCVSTGNQISANNATGFVLLHLKEDQMLMIDGKISDQMRPIGSTLVFDRQSFFENGDRPSLLEGKNLSDYTVHPIIKDKNGRLNCAILFTVTAGILQQGILIPKDKDNAAHFAFIQPKDGKGCSFVCPYLLLDGIVLTKICPPTGQSIYDYMVYELEVANGVVQAGEWIPMPDQ